MVFARPNRIFRRTCGVCGLFVRAYAPFIRIYGTGMGTERRINRTHHPILSLATNIIAQRHENSGRRIFAYHNHHGHYCTHHRPVLNPRAHRRSPVHSLRRGAIGRAFQIQISAG